jgi:hypothetical protein
MDMPEGTVVSWLRTTVSKGYFHVACLEKPVIENLLKVKVQAADSPLGYVWMRACIVPNGTPLGETTPATRLIPSHNPDPLPGPWEVKDNSALREPSPVTR